MHNSAYDNYLKYLSSSVAGPPHHVLLVIPPIQETLDTYTCEGLEITPKLQLMVKVGKESSSE